MGKIALVITAAAMLCLSGLEMAAAQAPVNNTAPANSPAAPLQHRPAQPSLEDQAAFAESRIAALKAGLKLSPEQETLWPGVEKLLRETAKARSARILQWRTERAAPGRASFDAVATLRNRARFMSNDAHDLAALADAAEPLYQALDEAQKRRFATLIRASAGPPARNRRPRQANGPAASTAQQP